MEKELVPLIVAAARPSLAYNNLIWRPSKQLIVFSRHGNVGAGSTAPGKWQGKLSKSSHRCNWDMRRKRRERKEKKKRKKSTRKGEEKRKKEKRYESRKKKRTVIINSN